MYKETKRRLNLAKRVAYFKSKDYKKDEHRTHSILSAQNQLYVKELRERATPEELIVKKYLEDNKVYHIFQKGFFKPFHRIVDFYIPKKKYIIEIDGGYHNDIKDRDFYKDLVWSKKGFKTIRILNEDVNNGKYIAMLSKFI